MKPPDYRLSNFENAYAFHDEYTSPRMFTKFAYTATRLAVRPSFSIEEETDTLLPHILEQGNPLIIAPNHTSDRLDQWPAAATASELERRYDTPIVDTVRVLGKSGFYTGGLVREFGIPEGTPAKLAQFLMTRFVNAMGTMPVYRPNDIESEEEDGRRLALSAERRLWETSIHHLKQGHAVGIFAEGTADTRDPREILPIKAGIGRLASRLVRETDQPSHILTLGMSYPEYQEQVNRKGNISVQPRKLRGTHIHIGRLHEIRPDETVRGIQAVVAADLQSAVTRSFEESVPAFFDREGNRIAA